MKLAQTKKYKRRWGLPAVVAGGTGLVLALAALVSASPAVAGQSPSRAVAGQPPSKAKATPAAPQTPSWWKGMHIVYDPAAFARAVGSKDWIRTPDGLAYKTCVHPLPSGARVDHGTIIYRNGTRHTVPPCTHPTLAYPSMRPAAGSASPVPSSVSPPGTSQYVAQWYWDSPVFLISLVDRFSVPSNPAQDGALIYYFPGFEGAGGILQPVLSWGDNGVVTNPNIWYITAWYGLNGKYYPSGSIHVLGSSYTIDGTIASSGCNAIGVCNWLITVGVEGGNSVSIPLNDVGPYFHVLGGVMEVYQPLGNCNELPPNGHEAFRNMSIANENGTISSSTTFTWAQTGQCSARVSSGTATSGDILWSS
jgi:hypothetical protein